ncbi:MAG: hypothetical protein AB7O62_00500 [Pirellulales bacterium]
MTGHSFHHGLDLVRRLLLVLESHGSADVVRSLGLDLDDPAVQDHLQMLADANLATASGTTRDGAISLELTSQGHAMLELAGNRSFWTLAAIFLQECPEGLSAASLQLILSQVSTSESVSPAPYWHDERGSVSSARIDSAAFHLSSKLPSRPLHYRQPALHDGQQVDGLPYYLL